MKVLVVAPHPDDEVLGVGGTILKYKSQGVSVAWLIATDLKDDYGWSQDKISEREAEINQVTRFFDFDKVYKLGFPTTKLDALPFGDVVQKISEVVSLFRPDEIFVPHLGDIHSDHKIIHNAVLSCTKWFRYPYIKRVLAYETISETEFGLDASHSFVPNVFVDISEFLDLKVKAMEIYSSEVSSFPFPRSRVSIEALARYRGSSSGFLAAEAFLLLRERVFA
jgi:LmbE family N-acetylglucosaminyl deacetylase